jgi:hypothetical protein
MRKNKKIEMKQLKHTIFNIKKYINSSLYLKKVFFTKTKNRKYNFDDLLYCILKITKLGISFRESPLLFNNENIYWTTIYKFNMKLIKYNIIEKTYNEIIKKYLNKTKNNIFLTDTTLIINKMGIDKIGFNPQLLKHKTSKISYITTLDGIPIDIYITSGNDNDCKILLEQLNQPNNNFKNIKILNNELLGDAGYDGDKIRIKLNELNFGKLICPRNKRNIKDLKKLEQLKLCDEDKIKLKKRSKIENMFAFLKSFKRVVLRYDKYVINYKHFVLLATLMIIIKKTSIDKHY